MKKILVTGASGFIGSNLIPELSPAGYQVQAAPGKFSAETDFGPLMEGVHAVVHLAARVHRESETAYEELNVTVTRRLAEAAAKAGVERFVFLSSVKAMGEATPHDQRWDESSTCEPVDEYGLSKWRAEQILRNVEHSGRMSVVILRLPLVYGPGVKANMAKLFDAVARGTLLPLGSVDNARSFLYVENLSSAILAALENPAAAGQTFLVTDGEDVSTPELIGRIARALGKRARLIRVPSGVLRLAARLTFQTARSRRILDSLAVDSGKIREKLGWKPPFTMDEGLRRTAAWFAAHPHEKSL